MLQLCVAIVRILSRLVALFFNPLHETSISPCVVYAHLATLYFANRTGRSVDQIQGYPDFSV